MDENQKPQATQHSNQVTDTSNGSQIQQPIVSHNIEQASAQDHKKLAMFGRVLNVAGIVGIILMVINPFIIISLLQLRLLEVWYVVVPLLLLGAGQYLTRKYKVQNSASSSQFESAEEQGAKKWKTFFIILAALNVSTIIFPILALLAVANSPASIIAIVLIPILMVGVVVLLVNVVAISRYLRKYKPQKKGMITGIVIVIISLILLLFPGFLLVKNNLPWYVDHEGQAERVRKEFEQKRNERKENGQKQQSTTNGTKLARTKEEAISLMQNCKADYFVGYTDINLVKDDSTKSWLKKAELSNTGIEISENAPKTYVFVSESMTAELQDTARQFRQSCYNQKKLYITIDDWIETEYPAGKWTRVKQ